MKTVTYHGSSGIRRTMIRCRLSLISLVLVLLLSSSCSGSSGAKQGAQQSPKQSQGGSGSEESGGEQSGEEEKGEPHEYIKDAKTVIIDLIESEKLDISDIVFVGENLIAVACPKEVGEKKSFLYDLEAKQTIKLPDNTTVIRKLENDDLFVNTGADGAYAILDGKSYTVKKAISRPGGVDESLDISPDGNHLAYVTSEGLFTADTDFQDPMKLIDAKREQDEFKTTMPRYPQWLDSNRISYKMLQWESILYCGVVMRDKSKNMTYESTRDSAIFPLVSGDFISRGEFGEYGKGIGLIDGISGGKKVISSSVFEYEGFTYDRNGKWVAFYVTNEEVTEESKWTGKLEIRSVTKGEDIMEFKTEKPNAMPIEDTAASPDGRFLLFTDIDKTGRRVMYRLEVDLEKQSEGGQGSS